MSNKRGRPSKFKDDYVELVKKLTLLGHTDEELCEVFEISESTFNRWKHDHPDFGDAIKKGREDADYDVVRALYRRAIGGYFKVPDPGDTVIEKYVPPDTTASIFWLKNRQKDKWRDKKEVDSNVNIKLNADEISDDVLAHIASGSSARTSQQKDGAKRSDKLH
ncbi:MAG: hypothetical protein AAF228_12820 [Pseudomonadota bacterium]